MKIQILDKNDIETRFLLEEVSPAFASALRRIMMSKVPTMAIEWVDFVKNDSALPDEVLANRLGQIPLTFDKNAYNLSGECKCKGKGCSRCQVKLSLKKVGPGMVYSEDLKSKSKDVRAAFEKIQIVELFDEQELEFEAVAQLGMGGEHAKWQGAVVGYKNVPMISIDKICDVCAKCVQKCVKKVLRVESNKLKIADPFECNMCLQCIDACPKDAIKVVPKEDSFIFNVETACGLPPEEVVMSAVDVLEAKAKEFGKGVKKLK